MNFETPKQRPEEHPEEKSEEEMGDQQRTAPQEKAEGPIFTEQWQHQMDALIEELGVKKEKFQTGETSPATFRVLKEHLAQRADAVVSGTLNTIFDTALNLPRKTRHLMRRGQKGVSDLVKPKAITPTETFSPEEELQEIKQLPKEQRRNALVEFKEKFAYQRESLARIQEQMERFIYKNPDASPEELFQQVKDMGRGYGLNQSQEELIQSVLHSYVKKHGHVREIREKYTDDADLYRTLFGKIPKGKVEVIAGPISLLFRCYDPEDYARIVFTEDLLEQRPVTESRKLGAAYSRGVKLAASPIKGLENAIIAEKVSARGDFAQAHDASKTLRHEEEHALQALFEDKLQQYTARVGLAEVVTADNNQERRRMLYKFLRSERLSAERVASNEILAHLKTETLHPGEVIYALTAGKESGSPYNITEKVQQVAEALRAALGSEDHSIIEEALTEVFQTEYHQLIEEGVKAFTVLLDHGYSRERAGALLLQEPFSHWKKLVKRLVENK